MSEISVKVEYLGVLRNALGLESERVNVSEGAAVGDVLRLLCDKYGERLTSIILRRDGGLRPLTRVLLNGHNIRDEAGLETRLDSQNGKPLPGSPWPAGQARSQPHPTGWDRRVDEAWSGEGVAALSGRRAAFLAARALGVSRLRDSEHKTLQGLLDASEYLRSQWSRDGNSIVRGHHELSLTFGIQQMSGG